MSKKEDKAMEQKWQAQEDARVLAMYQEIIGNKTRLGRATREAKKQTKELEKQISVMKKVSKKK